MPAQVAPQRLPAPDADEPMVLVNAAKKRLSASLTHQMEMIWPWPQRTLPTDTAGSTDQSMRGSMTSEKARRYGRETHIAALTVEPCRPPAYGTCRVGMLLTPGTHFWLPLIGADRARAEPGTGRGERACVDHPVYWQVPHKPAHGAAMAAPPLPCAELVVGEVYAIEAAARRRRDPHVRRSPRGAIPGVLARVVVEGGSSTRRTRMATTDTTTTASSSGPATVAKTPVYTHWLQTIPYRVVFSQTWADTLFVSLPCEERLLTLRVPSRLTRSATTAAASSADQPPLFRDAASAGSLSLARGVVPLELVEVLGRQLVVVGTYEHGVLLCGVSETTATMEAVLRTVALAGHGSALFPVVRIAAISPVPDSRHTASTATPAAPFFPWATKAASLASSADGALLVSSPYEQSVALLKLSDHRSGHGRREDFPLQPPLGALQAVGLYPAAQAHAASKLAIANVNRIVLLTQRSTAHAEEAAGTSGHLAPAVKHVVVYRHPHLLVRLADSPPTCYQTYYHANQRPSAVYTPSFIRHFLFAVDGKNTLLLLDRKVQNYALASTFTLTPVTPPVPKEQANSAAGAPSSSRCLKRERDSESVDDRHQGAATTASTAATLPCGLVEPDELTALCSGLAVIATGRDWLCVAAAHDHKFVSLVTWRPS